MEAISLNSAHSTDRPQYVITNNADSNNAETRSCSDTSVESGSIFVTAPCRCGSSRSIGQPRPAATSTVPVRVARSGSDPGAAPCSESRDRSGLTPQKRSVISNQLSGAAETVETRRPISGVACTGRPLSRSADPQIILCGRSSAFVRGRCDRSGGLLSDHNR